MLVFLVRNGVAVRILRVLAVHGKLYTRQLLRLAGAHDEYGLATLRQLAALGLVRREPGELCRGRGRCVRVVWNVITREGVEALRELGELSDVEEVLAEERALQ